MAKTNFINGNPAQGIQGTIVTAEFLNALNTHRHRGLAEDGDGAIDYAPDTGAANAYVIALTPALTARVVGMPIHFMAANTNTGPSTLNDGLGIVDISKNFNQSLAAGDIKAGQIITVAWDGVAYQTLGQAGAHFKIGLFLRDQSLAPGTQAVTGVGFQPSVVIFMANQTTVAGETSWGFDDGTNAYVMFDYHNISANTFSTTSTISIELFESAGSETRGHIQSLDPDGFTINWSKAGSPTGTVAINYLALK